MEKSKNKNSFCIRPFNSIHLTTDGSMKICCDIVSEKTQYLGKNNFNLKTNSIEEFWTSGYRKYLQKQFLEKDKPNECQKCWHKEDKGNKSLREFSNHQYKILGNKNPEDYLKILGLSDLAHPEDYNIDITNLCNLKCYMCTGKSSSKLLVENNDLGLENLDQKDYDYDDSRLLYLIEQIEKNNVSHLSLQGGEPLMNPKIILLLQKLSIKETAKNLTVWITTNGTMYDQKIFETLASFKTVKIIFSIDGVGKVNDYMRFPSNFSEIKSNIYNYLKLENATFMITNVVQNFNVLYVKEIIDFANSCEIHCHLHVLVEPSYLHFSVLPISARRKALERLQEIDKGKRTHVTNFDSLLENLQDNIDTNTSDKLKFFKDIIKKRNAYRKINLGDYVPELAKELNI